MLWTKKHNERMQGDKFCRKWHPLPVLIRRNLRYARNSSPLKKSRDRLHFLTRSKLITLMTVSNVIRNQRLRLTIKFMTHQNEEDRYSSGFQRKTNLPENPISSIKNVLEPMSFRAMFSATRMRPNTSFEARMNLSGLLDNSIILKTSTNTSNNISNPVINLNHCILPEPETNLSISPVTVNHGEDTTTSRYNQSGNLGFIRQYIVSKLPSVSKITRFTKLRPINQNRL
ncbi:1597_t:CDS:2 [Funneliformis caledonium]|uniref:1597_t:CDS:1 n=1 Tax=Funneliformis caledonium TaxID=1117310 RepID=A0A9N9NFR1_9GLOM|nr:1597_t:CDS:2 [Funneliformis caledonium]